MSSPSNGTSSGSGGQLSSGGIVAVSVTSLIVIGVVLIVVAVLIRKCIRDFKRTSRDKDTATGGTSATCATGSETLALALASSPQELNSSIDIPSIERFLDTVLKEKPVRFLVQHLIAFTNNFSEKLGAGAFGIVYKGEFTNGVKVAVKVFNQSLEKKVDEQFMAEVGTMGRTYHINLVKLYGFCCETNFKALVYEFMPKSSLDRHLFDKNSRIKYRELLEIAIGTAKGIRYLHEECAQRIIHYDIKPGNVLLDEDFSPKVADFGLAKLCSRQETHVTLSGGRGTPGYAAPELWLPMPVTYKCDVYSFGMLLFEIASRRRNLDFSEDGSREWLPRFAWEMFEAGKMEELVSFCNVKEKHREEAERMFQVAIWCVQYRAEARPTMSEVVKMLEKEMEIGKPANPFTYITAYDADSGFQSRSSGSPTSISMNTKQLLSSTKSSS